MKYTILDVETTTYNKGHPFDRANRLVVTGWKTEGEAPVCMYGLEYVPEALQPIVDDTLVVGFNIKFDLHWIRKAGIKLDNVRIWDCQLAEFILGNQLERMPALDDVCKRRGLGSKVDVIYNNYWSKGIDTPDIPVDVLNEYLIQDLELTEKLYLAQVEGFKKYPEKLQLFKLECMDLLVLEEMEWNGLPYNVGKSLRKSFELDEQAEILQYKLNTLVGSTVVNWNSNDHVSAVLYGGVVTEETKVPNGIFKTGKRAGEIKYKNVEVEHVFPRLIRPLKGTELAKAGYYSTSEDVLNSLKAKGKVKEIIDTMLTLSKLEKENGTYYQGIPARIAAMGWDRNILHGSLNKCVAITGRLSSSNPNLQNMPEAVSELIESRFE